MLNDEIGGRQPGSRQDVDAGRAMTFVARCMAWSSEESSRFTGQWTEDAVKSCGVV